MPLRDRVPERRSLRTIGSVNAGHETPVRIARARAVADRRDTPARSERGRLARAGRGRNRRPIPLSAAVSFGEDARIVEVGLFETGQFISSGNSPSN